jgi:hypothetical protein
VQQFGPALRAALDTLPIENDSAMLAKRKCVALRGLTQINVDDGQKWNRNYSNFRIY